MIDIHKAADRGQANHGWLKSAHTFSFANYFNPQQIGFSDLLVINDDRVDAGKGFGAHPHNDMEIFSYVLKGALSHQDSMGNGDTIYPGDIQLMSAGRGIIHSEMNGSNTEPVHFLQIWILPNVHNAQPQYQKMHISAEDKKGKLKLFLSPDNPANAQDNTLTIRQDAAVYAGLFSQGDDYTFTLNPIRYYYLHIATGHVDINGITMNAGDGARIRQEDTLRFSNGNDAEVLLFDLRPIELPQR